MEINLVHQPRTTRAAKKDELELRARPLVLSQVVVWKVTA
jgi:hypothetical protein